MPHISGIRTPMRAIHCVSYSIGALTRRAATVHLRCRACDARVLGPRTRKGSDLKNICRPEPARAVQGFGIEAANLGDLSVLPVRQ
jgi:hypothetical protein